MVDESQDIEQVYQEQLKRRDEEIKKLKEENLILLKVSLKKSKELDEMKNRLELAMKNKPEVRSTSKDI